MIQFPSDWNDIVWDEFEKEYFQTLIVALKKRKAQWEQMFPQGSDIFRTFWSTPLQSVKVVILWQDPYHGDGQAHGLSFSVPDGVTMPPSLKNIAKELYSEYWTTLHNWNLTWRAEQWVLLLNAILTVKAHEAASHHKLWREQFTDSVIHRLSQHHDHLVFCLRGNFARSKKTLIDTTKHLILEASHPSPLSAHQGFLWCGHFRAANEWLEKHWKKQIERVVGDEK
jgi:uracil-DNA glycosylase